MRETLNMGDRVADMLRQALVVFEKSDPKLVKEVEKSDNAVDELHEAIKLYLVKASKAEMTDEESQRYVEIITFTTNLEHVGDIIDKNLMELAAKKIKNRYTFSPEGLEEIRKFHAPRDGQHAACLQRVRDARRCAGAPPARREGDDARGRARGRRQPLRAAARGPSGVDRDQRDPSRRDARPQAHQRPPDLGRLSDPGSRGRVARQPPARARSRAAEPVPNGKPVPFRNYCSRISDQPADDHQRRHDARRAAAAPSGSTTAITAANNTLVSRSAATSAIGATVIAQIAIQ